MESKEVKKIISELENLKEAIEESKELLARCEGRKQELEARLKKEFGIESLTEAEERIKALRDEINELEKKLERRFKKLKERYEW